MNFELRRFLAPIVAFGFEAMVYAILLGLLKGISLAMALKLGIGFAMAIRLFRFMRAHKT